MASLFDRIAALHSSGPFRAERVTADTALKGGRHPVLDNPQPHVVLGTPLAGVADWPAEQEPQRDSLDEIIVGLGCFWGAERLFWSIPGVVGTSVGYAGGFTQNPTYREVCTGRTGHAEVVRIVFNPVEVSLAELLRVAFENHDPTTGDRQGNDVGSQYRSTVYASGPAPQQQMATITELLEAWKPLFAERGMGEITTEISPLSDAGDGRYYLAEDSHQQYLAKNPQGYCNHGSNGVCLT